MYLRLIHIPANDEINLTFILYLEAIFLFFVHVINLHSMVVLCVSTPPDHMLSQIRLIFSGTCSYILYSVPPEIISF